MLLTEILADFNASHQADRLWRETAAYKLNTFWGGSNQAEIFGSLGAAANIEEALALILNSELYTHHAHADVVDLSIRWHLDAYRRLGLDLDELPPAVAELNAFPESQRRSINGRRISPDLFRHVFVAQYANRLLSRCTRPRVIELGSGTGTVAAMMRALGGNGAYVLCDISESLVFARLALAVRYPEARTLWVKDRRDLEPDKLDEYDFVFMPTMFASDLDSSAFDLFMNFHSLGEFDNSATRFWMQWLQAGTGPGHILVCNRYLNFGLRGRHEWRLHENEASVGFDARWRPLTWELEPRHLACPYIRTVNSRYLLLAAQNGGPMAEEVRKEEARRSLQAAMQTNALAVLREGPPTSYRLGMLNHDLGMTGPLFHLWNAVRLDENADTLKALLAYIDALFPNGERFIEERSFYAERLRRYSPDEPCSSPSTVNGAGQSHAGARRIRLLAEHAGYNIVRLGDQAVAILQALGPLDLDKERLGDRELLPYVLRLDDIALPESEMIARLALRIDHLRENT